MSVREGETATSTSRNSIVEELWRIESAVCSRMGFPQHCCSYWSEPNECPPLTLKKRNISDRPCRIDNKHIIDFWIKEVGLFVARQVSAWTAQ
ncbi:hypothetical protein TNCV_3018971 [Trichonephila clavipes]|nr:hypothetical protein TNCV_3018971 [Trichonephila clavipes]